MNIVGKFDADAGASEVDKSLSSSGIILGRELGRRFHFGTSFLSAVLGRKLGEILDWAMP